jgi:3'-phosphoadenosine 5'-phosphosulfate sulfotransferase (PAPS reductase)/FAD synthetase
MTKIDSLATFEPGFDSIERKVDDAIVLIRELAAGRRPVAFSSFGKDSLALLSLISEAGVSVDVAHFELGVVAAKHVFSRRFAARLPMPVHFLQPHRTTLVRGHDNSLAYHFDLAGGGSIRILGATFDDDARRGPLCGLRADLMRFGEHPPYPWDVVFCGRRASDADVTVGSLWWDSEVEPLGRANRVAMPLLKWSDEELLHYLQLRHINPDPSRYEVVDSTLRERADKSSNPDHVSCCIKCLATPRGGRLHCPISNSTIVSFSDAIAEDVYVSGSVPPAVMC